MNKIDYTVSIPDTAPARAAIDDMASKVTAAQERAEINAKKREEPKAPPLEAKSTDEETNGNQEEKPKPKKVGRPKKVKAED